MHGSVTMPVDLNGLKARIKQCRSQVMSQQIKVEQLETQERALNTQIQSEYGVTPENLAQEIARVDQEVQSLQSQISKSLSDIGY